VGCTWAGWEGDDARTHCAVGKQYSCLTYSNDLREVRLCIKLLSDKDFSDNNRDSGTDTETVQSFVSYLISFRFLHLRGLMFLVLSVA
jgi:hypothetical protein